MNIPSFVTEYRQTMERMLDALEDLDAAAREWTYLDLTTTMPETLFDGSDITKSDLIAAAGSVAALRAVLDANGNGGKLYKVTP